MATKRQNEDIKEICDAASKDSVLRAALVRALARDFPKDFLAPVKVQGENLGRSFRGMIVSCKEWQE